MKKTAILILLLFAGLSAFAQSVQPYGSYFYAQKDGEDLFLDYYPATGEKTFDGKEKPAIIFVFGGGFKGGTRNNPFYGPWFSKMNELGYTVFSIDYRLGLKDATKAGVGQVKEILKAVDMAVEDLYDATAFIIDNAAQFGVDPANIVISGSSAGAITSLQADWYLCNGNPAASVLPEGFRYAGVMSFSGALLSNHGMPSYKSEPAPTLMLHGTEDKIVNYDKLHILNWAFTGSSRLAKIFSAGGYNYNVLRYDGHGHDIASSMAWTVEEQVRFLETNVIRGVHRVVDATLDDPDVPKYGGSSNRKELYGN